MSSPLRTDDTQLRAFARSQLSADFPNDEPSEDAADALNYGQIEDFLLLRSTSRITKTPSAALDVAPTLITGDMLQRVPATWTQFELGKIGNVNPVVFIDAGISRSVVFIDAWTSRPVTVPGKATAGELLRVPREWCTSRALTVADRITSELGRLRPEWAGPGSVSPSQELIQQVEFVLDRLPLKASMPQIEVEEEDGSVALRWIAPNKKRSFSLVFRGNGRVTGVLATVDPPQSRSWSAQVTDEIRIASEFEDVDIFD
jgi:hypothetical protein